MAAPLAIAPGRRTATEDLDCIEVRIVEELHRQSDHKSPDV
ncbi:hypothetical protein [Couchioplanes caeruleus]|nr:hypothetical protein [Couchioplanes caeruleus]